MLRPYVERLLGAVGSIQQPSIQWHVAQILEHLHGDLDEEQATRAVAVLQRNLTDSDDWIVLNVTMDVLASWASDDPGLRAWLRPRLADLERDPRKSVSKRAANTSRRWRLEPSARGARVRPTATVRR